MMRFSFYKYLDSVWKSLRVTVTVINILSWPFYWGKGSGVLSWLFFSFISQAPQFTYLTTLCPSLDYLQQRACGCRVVAKGWGGRRTALSSCFAAPRRVSGRAASGLGWTQAFLSSSPLPLPFTVPCIMCRVPQGSTHRAGHLQEGSRRSPPATRGSARFPNISLTVSSWVEAEMKMDPPHELLL